MASAVYEGGGEGERVRIRRVARSGATARGLRQGMVVRSNLALGLVGPTRGFRDHHLHSAVVGAPLGAVVGGQRL